MLLLDTNVITELRRPERADPTVVAWASRQPAASQFLSSISILEIELGVQLIERRDGTQGAILRAWIDSQILPHFEGRILAIGCGPCSALAFMSRIGALSAMH